MKQLSRPLMTILGAALALGLSGSDLMAAKKKGSDRGDSKKGKKEQAHHAPSRGHVASNRSSSSHRSAPVRHIASSKAKPKTHHVASSRSKGRSRSDDHRVASHRLASASPRHHVAQAKKTIHRDHSPSKGDRADRARALASSRDRTVDHRHIGSSARHSSDADRRRLAGRSHDDDRRHVAGRSHADHNHSDRHVHRDRSHYASRHEHHDHSWYADNGWEYDRDYWQSNHRHRYYNDGLSAFIFDVSARPDYGYYPAPQRYYGGYSSGYDYATRVAVQEELARAGYYEGDFDGVIGSGSRSAIYNYQLDNGLAASGRINDELLQSLGLI